MSSIPFQPIRTITDSLDQRVVTAIRDRVEQGELHPGDRLPSERELALQFGISRTALREALHTLAAQGIIETRHGRGIFISGSSATATIQRLADALGTGDHLARLHELFAIRRILEGSAAEWAAERANPAQIEALHAVLREAHAAITSESPAYTVAGQLDARFHALVAASAANRSLMLLMGTLLSELGVARGHSLKIPGRVERSVAQHIGIVNAIAAHDAPLARQCMLDHLDDVESDIVQDVAR